MKTDMPKVIYAEDLNHYYIRSEKHEELKAIAEKMVKLIELIENKTIISPCAIWPDDIVISAREILTEYNKYKGE